MNAQSKKTAEKKARKTTIDQKEVDQFRALADEWWDEKGPFRPLHRLNPVRLSYIRDRVLEHHNKDSGGFSPLSGLSVLDIGCGGGLVTEPLCRMGASVTGLDAGAENIEAARQHAQDGGLEINYICDSAENLATASKKYDVVLALEIIEHVADPALFIQAATKLVKKDGLIILSTLNRTAKSYALGIVAAEHLLRWVPVGTHDWKKFVKPSEIAWHLSQNGFTARDVTGMIYNPLTRDFGLSRDDLAVNYLMTATR